MLKVSIALSLVALYALYSFVVYTDGTESRVSFPAAEQALISEGKQIYQDKNCQACHQIYGLGGFLGPDLTTGYSDKHRGEPFLRAMMTSGGSRMPNFRLNNRQVDALIAYLKYVDSTATPIKQPR
ncbi:MAG TPA: cytochrome c [Flavisolibacter sp.]